MSLTPAQKASIVAKDPRYSKIWGEVFYWSRDESPPPTTDPEKRTKKCIHLGTISERKSSCWKLCIHHCDKGHSPARPGIECQVCTEYEAE